MAAERDPVREHRRALEERLHHRVARDDGADRRVRGRQPLGRGHEVGLDVVALRAEPGAEPAEAGDHLVGAEQDPMLVADRADARPVALRRRERAARVLHRLHDHHRDRPGPGLLDRRLEVVEQERGELLLRLLGRAVVAVRVPHVEDVGDERLERVAERGDPVDRERAHRRAVVGRLARDRLPAPLAAGRVVLTRELPGRLDRLGAARAEEDAVQVARRERRHLGRQLDRARMRVGPVRVEGQLAHLRGGRLADLLAVRVADLHGEEPGQRVEVALAVRILEVAAVAADDDRDLGAGVSPHAREVQPEMLVRGALELLRG